MVCIGAGITLPQVALAELPLPNDVFGRFEGTLDYCAQVNPESAAKYQEQKKVLAHGASEKELSEARASSEYKESYDLVKDELSKEPKAKVAKGCAGAVETKN